MITAFAVCLCLAFLSFGILVGLARALRDLDQPADAGSAPASPPTSARLVGLKALEDALTPMHAQPPLSEDQHWRFVATAYQCDEGLAVSGDPAARPVRTTLAAFAPLADRPAVRAM